MSIVNAIAIAIFVGTLLLWSVIDTIRDYIKWKAEQDRQIDELLASLSAPAPEDPAHEAKYRHLRSVPRQR